MKLLTGRRHQLRVHCLCLGHPIVGDVSYNPSLQTQNSNIMVESTVDTCLNYHDREPVRRSLSKRMMLHAYHLR
jgi:23S rRNA-/tRNA-specific pseudouridylate synthase